jgi:hypothetical protein
MCYSYLVCFFSTINTVLLSFFSNARHIAPTTGRLGLHPIYHNVTAFAPNSPEENALKLLQNHEVVISEYAEYESFSSCCACSYFLKQKIKKSGETKTGRGTGFYVTPNYSHCIPRL